MVFSRLGEQERYHGTREASRNQMEMGEMGQWWWWWWWREREGSLASHDPWPKMEELGMEDSWLGQMMPDEM